MIYVLFVRTKAVSNGCKRTLWKIKRVQVSDLHDNNWQLFSQKKAESTNSMMKHVNYKHYFSYVSMIAFGYPKLTFDTSMTFIRYDCRL